MKDAIMVSRAILNAHPEGVRSLFRRFNIGAEPTPRTIILASQAFGPQFTSELAALYPAANYTGLDLDLSSFNSTPVDYAAMAEYGYDPALATAPLNVNGQASPKTSWLDSIIGVFNKVTPTILQGVNVVNAVKTGSTPQTTDQAAVQAQIAQQQYALQMQAEQEAAAAKTKQYLVLGGILILVVVAAVFIFRKK